MPFSSQAEFSEINLVANSQGAYSVTVDAIRNGHKVNKYVLCSIAVLNFNMCRAYRQLGYVTGYVFPPTKNANWWSVLISSI